MPRGNCTHCKLGDRVICGLCGVCAYCHADPKSGAGCDHYSPDLLIIPGSSEVEVRVSRGRPPRS